MQVLSINLDDELMERFEAVSGQLDVNQIQALQDAVREKVEQMEEMSVVLTYLGQQGVHDSASDAWELLDAPPPSQYEYYES